MIVLRGLSLSRGSKLLLENVHLTIHDRQRIGIVGANGSGKSSLFALLRGEIHQESGELAMPPGLVIAAVEQETPALSDAARDYVLAGDAELVAVQAALIRAEAQADDRQLAQLHARYEAIDGYGAAARAARLLHGLGFGEADQRRPVAEFSGGWRVRLNLARALMCRSDLLLLDEPTNHLDLDAILWLERWLAGYRGTLLLVSHDRDFLDNTVQRICHLEQRRLRLYSGNYSDFETQRAGVLAGQQAAWERQQREIARTQRFVERFRAKATKARQAQSRLKALERMERISPAHVDSPFGFTFREPRASPDLLLRLMDVAAGYGGTPVLSGLDLAVEAGARIGLIGPNGAGKSTLVKLLAGVLPPAGGRRVEGKGLALGYFAQHQLEQLDPSRSALQHLQKLDPAAREQELRDFLGGFGFRGDAALAPCGHFSGGEKSRLVLALLVWQRPNLLLLDEPTNHLDLEMRHALTVALQEFEGALVLVSHDRQLLRTCADRLLLVAGGKAGAFDGDLDDYRDWLARRDRGTDPAAIAEPGGGRRMQRRLEAEARNRLAALRRPLEARLKSLDAEIARLAGEKAELEENLASPALYEAESREKLKGAMLRQAEVAALLEKAEEEWLSLAAELEAIG